MRRIPLLAGLVFTTVVASAGPPPTPPFSVHDLDRDGYLDRAEYDAMRAHQIERWGSLRGAALLEFDTLDADGDGRIGEDELLNVLGRRYRGGGRGAAH
jgi:Ca2+-binding EF-hand superfamily protein